MQKIRAGRRILREDGSGTATQIAAGCGDLGAAMLDLRPLLVSAAPNVELEVETMPCPGRTPLTREDLACVLLDRVRCSASTMAAGGRLRVTAQYGNGFNFLDRVLFPHAKPENVVITIEERSAKSQDRTREHAIETVPIETVPTEIDERVRAAGARLRSHLPPGRGIRLELDVPVT